MVLRIKEREEAIQLITMDPKVCGKLLTHHRRGYGVDVEALRDGCPLQRSSGIGPKMGSHGYRRLRWWNQVFGSVSGSLGVRRYIQEEGVRRWSNRGPMRVEGTPMGGRRAPLPRGLLLYFLTQGPSLLDLVRSENHVPEGFIPFGLRLIFLFHETLKQAKKQQFGLGLR